MVGLKMLTFSAVFTVLVVSGNSYSISSNRMALGGSTLDVPAGVKEESFEPKRLKRSSPWGTTPRPTPAFLPPPPPPPPPPHFPTHYPPSLSLSSTSNGMGAAQRAWYRSQGYPNPIPSSYAPGYSNFPGFGKYKVYRHGATWSEALLTCISEGSILAVINDEAEAEVIKDLIIGSGWPSPLVSSNMYFYWVGAKETGTHGVFKTLHGGLLGVNNSHLRWALGNAQPDNYGNEDCVGFMHDKTYFDAVCSERIGFVCEKVT